MKNIHRQERRNARAVRRGERVKRRILGKALRGGTTLLLLALSLTGGYGAGTLGSLWVENRLLESSFFTLRTVRIVGNQTLSEETVLHGAGLRLGESLMAADLEKVRDRLRAHALIREAAVIRRLPSEVIIEIEERVPVAVVRSGRDYLVDREGIVMRPGLDGTEGSLPCLTGLRMEQGRVAPAALRDLYAGMAVVRAVLAAGFPPPDRVDCVDLGAENDAVLLPSGKGPVVHVGRKNLMERLKRWQQVAPDMAFRWEGLEYLDLRADGLVVAKPLETRPEAPVPPGGES